jgi:D-hexose-6-phosphate mutarotase
LPKISVKTNWSTAEIYLLGAHITGFQKNGEPPLLFMSRESQFAVDKPIRGGVPIVFPWFGPREGRALHGFARVTEWEWEESSGAPDSSATLRFRLPDSAASADGSPSANVSFAVTVSDKLTMELAVANPSGTENLSFENCLHTYFAIGDIAQVEITGLKGTTCIDRVANTQGVESAEAIRINQKPTASISTPPKRWKFTTLSTVGRFAWRKATRPQRWFGIHGWTKPGTCPILVTRNSSRWSAWNPATWRKTRSPSPQANRRL